jgi:signal transduction histidine kinase
MEGLDLNEVVDHTVKANGALFDGTEIILATRLSNGRVPIIADRDKIIQVVTNLLSNAAKFTPDGGRVSVRAFAEDGQAVVEVEDTGIGIPPDQLHTIFEKFRQVGDTLTTKPKGAGLGLPISQEIVQHHGGSLTVRSALGRGSCFRMTLPLAR